MITQSFASKFLTEGDTWIVYLNASDPDGGMKYIVCTIYQPGIGTSPVSFTRIKEERRRELSGYIYWNTGGGYGLNLSNITPDGPNPVQGWKFQQPGFFSPSIPDGRETRTPSAKYLPRSRSRPYHDHAATDQRGRGMNLLLLKFLPQV